MLPNNLYPIPQREPLIRISAVLLMLFATFAAQVCMTLAGYEAVYLVWDLFSNGFQALPTRKPREPHCVSLCLGLGGWASQTVISRGLNAFGSTWLPTIAFAVNQSFPV